MVYRSSEAASNDAYIQLPRDISSGVTNRLNNACQTYHQKLPVSLSS
ncbi:hypothetical protein [Ruminococcus sp.]